MIHFRTMVILCGAGSGSSTVMEPEGTDGSSTVMEPEGPVTSQGLVPPFTWAAASHTIVLGCFRTTHTTDCLWEGKADCPDSDHTALPCPSTELNLSLAAEGSFIPSRTYSMLRAKH